MYVHFACKGRPRNDLQCVGWDVKPYLLTRRAFSSPDAQPNQLRQSSGEC